MLSNLCMDRREHVGSYEDPIDLEGANDCPLYELMDSDDDSDTERVQFVEDLDDDDFGDSDLPKTVDEPDVVFLYQRQAIRDHHHRWGGSGVIRPARERRTRKQKKRPFAAWEPRAMFQEGTQLEDGCVMPCGSLLAVGDFVELRSPVGFLFKSEDFFQISSIFRHDGQTFLRGWIYRRTNTLEGMLPRNLNEVYKVLQYVLGDDRDVETQSLHDIPLTRVWRRRKLVCTNRDYPEMSFRDEVDFTGASNELIVALAKPVLHLTCRWRRVFVYRCISDLEAGVVSQKAILRLTENESDFGRSTPDRVLRGRFAKCRPDHVDFGDIFAGGGGVSSGAREAGFKVKFALDKNSSACATYRSNFPEATVFEEEVYSYLTTRFHPDSNTCVIHISSVCKTLSPAHTVDGRDDEANAATLYVVSDILSKTRPRVCTLEQTAGALHPRHTSVFNSFVQQFTSMGYSVRWALQNLSEFGVPQSRKRLIMIASCAGHPLPEFPTPTHGEGHLPFVTVAEALAPIAPGAPNHIMPTIVRPGKYVPYDPYQLLPGCITTTGGQNWHPDGARLFTVRELACLQTFPLEHVFVGNRGQTMCQVGNAVPPRYSTLLYEEIMRVLLEVESMDREPIFIENDMTGT
ncbi:S-adenosyl-L-methionine-dependent methyltransferase, partial [Aureobasidium melanogenum]